MTSDYAEHARKYLDSSRAAIKGLQELRKAPRYGKDEVAQFYDDIRQATKLAEVSALIAIAERLDDLIHVLDDGRLSDDEVQAIIRDGDNLRNAG